MALIHKDGKYIKVIRENCVFYPSSVLISYYEFDSKEDRDNYFKREKEINDFVSKHRNTYNELNLKAAETLSQVPGVDLNSFDQFPKEVKKILNDAIDLMWDLQLITREWKSQNFSKTKFKNKKQLIELGFNEEWFTPVKLPVIGTVSTGVFLNQTFSFDCLYKELKKIFKTDFVDC